MDAQPNHKTDIFPKVNFFTDKDILKLIGN